MKKLMALVLVLLSVTLCVAALADGVAAITECDFTAVDRGDNKAGVWFSGTIENTGDAPIYVPTIIFHLKDSAGNVFNEKKSSVINPSYLDPGDKGYFLIFQNLSDVPSMDAIAEYDYELETKTSQMSRNYQNSESAFELKGSKECTGDADQQPPHMHINNSFPNTTCPKKRCSAEYDSDDLTCIGNTIQGNMQKAAP